MRPVRNLLTAGSSLRVVQRDRNDRDRYYVHAELYTTLARIRARELAMAARMRRPHRLGGALDAASRPSPTSRAERLLANGHANRQRRRRPRGDEELRAAVPAGAAARPSG